MNIMNIEHISKIFGEKTIFDDASIGIQEGDKIGIVGINGTGKSTLLRMIAGDEVPDSGNIIRQNQLKLAWLPQEPKFPENATILSYAGDDETGWKVQSNLSQLGIMDYSMPIDQLSGGQKRKVALAKVLAQDFDVLLLDEPTNHLDSAMIRWLEDYLKNFRGTILMVTHDRYFLDQVTNKILEISQGKIYSYESNYSGFLELKAAREEMELATERKRQSVLRMELEWAKRGCRARTTKQRARLERLEALKNGTAPEQAQVVEMDSIETRMGKKTIELQHLSKRYGDKVILDDYSYIFLKNQKVGIIGPNGCGKSTLMKMLVGQVAPDSGAIEIGETIRMGYFAQDEKEMDDRQRVIDYVKDIGEYIITRDGRISASQMLERFLFTPEMQYAPIGKLSGGEKRRLYLLGVLCQNINVLLLDEASNNLDIPTMTILEDYLNSFVGIVVAVSHDRYFINQTATRILELTGETVVNYIGNYDYYLEKHDIMTQLYVKPQEISDIQAGKQDDAVNKLDWQAQKAEQARIRKIENSLKKIEDEIAALEEEISAIDEECAKPENAVNSAKLNELAARQQECRERLETCYETWEDLSMQLDGAKDS